MHPAITLRLTLGAMLAWPLISGALKFQDPPSKWAILNVRLVTNIAGTPLWREVQVTVTGPTGTKAHKYSRGRLRIPLLPGEYTLDVDEPGIVSRPVKVVMWGADRWLTFPFGLEYPVDRVLPKGRPTIEGTINIRDEATWLKLVAVYGQFQQETQADSSGHFALDTVHSGLYLLIATRPGQKPITQEVRVTSEFNELIVNVSFPPGSSSEPVVKSPASDKR